MDITTKRPLGIENFNFSLQDCKMPLIKDQGDKVSTNEKPVKSPKDCNECQIGSKGISNT